MTYHVKSVLRWLPKREQHTQFCRDSNKRSCCVDLHDVIDMGYTALYQIAANFWPNKKFSFVGWTMGTLAMTLSKG